MNNNRTNHLRKVIKQILFIFILLLFNNIFGQYKEYYDKDYNCQICKCPSCINGKISKEVKYKCPNCIDWADSYRNSRGCDVCKNKKYIVKIELYNCDKCNGLGKVKNTYYTPEGTARRDIENKKIQIDKEREEVEKDKELKEYEIKKDVENYVNSAKYFLPSEYQIKKDLIGKKSKSWKFEKIEEFEGFKATYSLPDYYSENKQLKIEFIGTLKHYQSKKEYDAEIYIIYDIVRDKSVSYANGWKAIFSKVIENETSIDPVSYVEDDYYIDAKTCKKNKNKNEIEVHFENGGFDLLDKYFLSNKDKEILGIQNWRYVTDINGEYNYSGKIIKVIIKGQGATIKLVDNLDERFDLAKRLIQDLDERIR